jgi:glycosyltransferase involved in cell wall biosynthesis
MLGQDMKIAIVVPRYGNSILGGAESQARGFAEESVRQGWDVEVWTTCAQSHYTWDNYYSMGEETVEGVLVRRFPITHWNPTERAQLDRRLQSQGQLPLDEEIAWLESGPHSLPLYSHMLTSAEDYDAILALPYAAPLVHVVAWLNSKRLILWPCLHDEPYAYMEVVRLAMEHTWGVIFFSPEESDLATGRLRMRPRHCSVLGGGVTLEFAENPLHSTDLSVSRNRLLYLGRLEGGKNLDFLYSCVQRYVSEGGDLRLTVAGKGPLEPPRHPAFEYLGFVSEAQKAELYVSSLALCQPSINESFSLTIMESWLAQRPVLVHRDCAVTHGHVRRSKGGLWFGSYEEFVAVVEWLQNRPQHAARMGENGRRYVMSNYTWQAAFQRFARLIHRWDESDE